MKLGAGRNLGLGIATLAVSLGFAAEAGAAKLPKFSVTSVSNPPSDVYVRATPSRSPATSATTAARAARRPFAPPFAPTTWPSNGPIVLGMTETDKVKKGASGEYEIDATVPQYTEAGTYYLVVCATPAKGSGCLVADEQVTVDEPEPVFEPGARSAGDELYPQTGNGGYDAEHYDIELNYDPVDEPL